jgi:hypothetical protein
MVGWHGMAWHDIWHVDRFRARHFYPCCCCCSFIALDHAVGDSQPWAGFWQGGHRSITTNSCSLTAADNSNQSAAIDLVRVEAALGLAALLAVSVWHELAAPFSAVSCHTDYCMLWASTASPCCLCTVQVPSMLCLGMTPPGACRQHLLMQLALTAAAATLDSSQHV